MITKRFSVWWLIFAVQSTVLIFAYHYNLHLYFYENDFTFISFLIAAIWLLSSIWSGIGVYLKKDSSESQWFVADSCMTLGMIGTVIGFIYMMNGTFTEIDPGNVDSMRRAISSMSTGMSTALLTTLAGLVGSLFIKAQLINQDAIND